GQLCTQTEDAAHILKLLVEGRFLRLWTPDREQRDLRQLVLHRHKLVMIRSRVKNELQHLSLNKGMQRKRRLWSQAGQQLLRELPLKKWAACRREDLLGLLTMLDEQIGKLNGAVQACSRREPAVEAFDDATGSGPKHRAGFRADHRRRRSFPARQAGGQLPGTNSTRRKFGRTAEAGGDHQAGQPHAAHVAGGSGAGGGGARSRIAQAVSPPLSSETQSCGQSGRGPQISRTTLLDAARTWPIQRSFASRAARGCPWSAQARPQVLIGRFRI